MASPTSLLALLIAFFATATATAASYDPILTARLVDLAGAAYCSPNSISSGENQHLRLVDDFTTYGVYNTTTLQFYVGHDESNDSIFVSVRGSMDLNNWLDNLDIVKTAPYPDSSIEVHAGFHKEYTTLLPNIISFVDAASDKFGTKKLSIAGHSSGAANSVLLAYDVARGDVLSGYELLPMTTFGCPRVGNSAFYESFQEMDITHTRVVHYKDIVPHVPYEWLGFHHTAQEVWYSDRDSTTWVECSSSDGEDDTCSNSLWMATSSSDHCEYLAKDICGCSE